MTESTWAATDDSIEAWDAVEPDAYGVEDDYADVDYADVMGALDRLREAALDRQEDRLARAGLL